jgi:hypothetical protein
VNIISYFIVSSSEIVDFAITSQTSPEGLEEFLDIRVEPLSNVTMSLAGNIIAQKSDSIISIEFLGALSNRIV